MEIRPGSYYAIRDGRWTEGPSSLTIWGVCCQDGGVELEELHDFHSFLIRFSEAKSTLLVPNGSDFRFPIVLLI